MKRGNSTSWRLRREDSGAVKEMSDALRISRPLAQVLASRGFSEPEPARAFLQPALNDLHDPFLLGPMEEAVDCITNAIRRKKRIVVFGDFDADGLCSSSIMARILKALGADVEVMIPNRLRDGYSLTDAAVARIIDSGAAVTITVDNGISANKAAESLEAAGIELIIADHHEPGSVIPPARAILNPKMPGSRYPYGELCATGVAFKLAWALTQRSPISGEKAQTILLESLGVVALATIADVAPLTGENRVLVTFGLRALRASRSPGIRALLRSARVQGPIVARDVAFRLAPMLNAPGRLGDARSSLDLLLSESDDEATQLARELSRINRKRRVIQKTVLDSALKRMREELDRGRQAIVLAEEDWHPGVTGIVAGHIARESNLPTVVITLEGSRGRASARSVPGAHLPELFDACRDLLISYGGHARAAGLVIERKNVEAFRDRFCEAVSQKCSGTSDAPLDVDAEVELGEMKPASVREMERLAPFGEGNPPPLLIAHRCRVAGAVRKRRGGLSFFLRQGDVALSARVGKGVDLPDGPGGPERLTVAFRPSVAGSGEVDLEVLDFPETRS